MTPDPVNDKWVCLHCNEEFEQPRGFRPFFCPNPNCGKKGPFNAITGPFIFFKGKEFVPKRLGEEIKEDRVFITTRDNSDCYVYNCNSYHLDGEPTIQEMVREKLDDLAKEHIVSETIHHIEQTTFIEREALDADNPFIVTENCILNPETLETMDHTPDIFTTISIPVIYDPTKDCPNIKQFISEIVDKDNIPLIQEIIGYLLLKSYKYQKAVMMLGSGANGKSTLIRVMAAMIGRDNISTPSLQSLLYDRFAASQLYHKLANLHADIPSKELKNVGLFKMLLGGDIINAQRKHRDSFDFINYAKLIYSANELPKTEDITPAFFRRWLLIRFPNTFPEGTPACDPDILEKLTTPDELSGLLNYALRGLKRLNEQRGFSETKTRTQTENEWIRSTDSLVGFVKDHVIQENGHGISKDNFFQIYTEYCAENEIDAVTKSAVGHRLPALIPQTSEFKPSLNGKRAKSWKDIHVTDVTAKTNNLSYIYGEHPTSANEENDFIIYGKDSDKNRDNRDRSLKEYEDQPDDSGDFDERGYSPP